MTETKHNIYIYAKLRIMSVIAYDCLTNVHKEYFKTKHNRSSVEIWYQLMHKNLENVTSIKLVSFIYNMLYAECQTNRKKYLLKCDNITFLSSCITFFSTIPVNVRTTMILLWWIWAVCQWMSTENVHDDVIKWKHLPRCWPFVRGIHRSPVNSPHKGQWRGGLMFSLICGRINDWVNNGEAGDLRRNRAYDDVIVMFMLGVSCCFWGKCWTITKMLLSRIICHSWFIAGKPDSHVRLDNGVYFMMSLSVWYGWSTPWHKPSDR